MLCYSMLHRILCMISPCRARASARLSIAAPGFGCVQEGVRKWNSTGFALPLKTSVAPKRVSENG